MFENSVLSWQFLSLRYEVHRTISDRTRPCAPFTSLSPFWRLSNANGQIALFLALRYGNTAMSHSATITISSYFVEDDLTNSFVILSARACKASH